MAIIHQHMSGRIEQRAAASKIAAAAYTPHPFARRRWRQRAEAVLLFASFLLLALILVGVWLTLMEANFWD